MEIVLLIAVIVVGASSLFVAATFNLRARKNFDPLMDAVKTIEAANGGTRQQLRDITDDLRRNEEQAKRLEAANGELRQRMQAITDQLRQDRQRFGRQETVNEELRQLMQAITDELGRNGQQAKRLEMATGELRQQMQAVTDGMRRDSQVGSDLARLDYRVAELGESLAQQSTRISGIHRYVMRRETQVWNSAENDSLLLAMLEAESHVDGKGWGERPHLYALTETTSAVAADHEFAAGMRGARPDALVPVEQQRLPDGDLIEALAGIHWPGDVVGCVLVAELSTLPSRREEDAPIDADAAGQWASAHPDGRPARLAIGVLRNGEHKCVFHIKDEDEIQVRTGLADDLVAALRGTF